MILLVSAYVSFVIPPQLLVATTQAAADAAPAMDSGSLLTGIACYAGGLAALTAWEEFVVPELKLRSIVPDVPIVKGQLTVKQKRSPWITPLTADGAVPALDDLRKGDVRVGQRNGVAQYLTLDDLRRLSGVQEPSELWSEVYKVPVTMYKKQRWS